MKMTQKMEIAERRNIAYEITNFCIEHGIFKGYLDIDEIRNSVEAQLENADFIESLINTIIVNTINRRNIDTRKVKILLLKLEKIRLELEYNGQ